MTTTPTEIALLRRVAEAAREVCLTGLPQGPAIGRMRVALRALDAYQPPTSWASQNVTLHAELDHAAREACKPRPPGELVDAVMDRVHEDVTEDQSRGEDIWLTRPRAVRGD